MPIRMNCPACDREYHLSDAMLGKRVSCKNCAEAFTVTDGDDDPIEVRPSAIRRDEDLSARPSGAKKSRYRDEDDEDDDLEEEDRPRLKKKKKSGSGLVIGLIGGVIALVVVGVVVLVFTMGGSGGGSWFHRAAFTDANVRKLKAGMTEEEIINILGPPTSEPNSYEAGVKILTYKKEPTMNGGVQIGEISFTLVNGKLNETPDLSLLDQAEAMASRFQNIGPSFPKQPGQPRSPFPKQPGQPGAGFSGSPMQPPGQPAMPGQPPQAGLSGQPLPMAPGQMQPPGQPGPMQPPAQPFPPGKPGRPGQPFVPGQTLPNPALTQRPTKDVSKLRPGMSEAELISVFGNAASVKNFEGESVTQANVTVQEVTGADGKPLPVKVLTYTKDNGQPGLLDITLVDGKIYKYQIRQ